MSLCSHGEPPPCASFIQALSCTRLGWPGVSPLWRGTLSSFPELRWVLLWAVGSITSSSLFLLASCPGHVCVPGFVASRCGISGTDSACGAGVAGSWFSQRPRHESGRFAGWASVLTAP